MLAMTFCSCKFVKPDKSDESGSTTEKNTKGIEEVTVYVTDKNNEYVTNKDGSFKTEKVDFDSLEEEAEKAAEEKTKKSDKKDSDKTDSDKNDSSKTTAKKGTDKTTAKTSGGSSGSKDPKDDLLPEGTKVNDTSLMKTSVEPVLKSGTYTVKGKVKAEGQNMDVIIAFRNSKDYCIEASIMGISMRIFSNGGKYYLALPTMKMYSEISAKDVGELNMDDIASSFKEKDAKFVKSTSVKSGTTTYTCEEYKTSSGTAKYYFNSKNEWKRMEVLSTDGTVMSWEITSFSKSADSKLFEVNSKWKKSAEIAKMFG